MTGKKKVPKRRSGLRPSEKELPERRSGAFRHKNTPDYYYYFHTISPCPVSVHEPGSNLDPEAHYILASGKYI
jgi:hypothetical protein